MTAVSVSSRPQALSLQPQEPFGVAYQGRRLFTAIGAVAGRRGEAGPPGVPGPAGGAALQRTAGETLSALRVVYELDGQVFALDYRDDDHIDLLLGVTLTAADQGQPINVQRLGAVDDSGWSWQLGRVWLGAAGALTQTPPTDGFDVLIGAATSATRITLNLTETIELE